MNIVACFSPRSRRRIYRAPHQVIRYSSREFISTPATWTGSPVRRITNPSSNGTSGKKAQEACPAESMPASPKYPSSATLEYQPESH